MLPSLDLDPSIDEETLAAAHAATPTSYDDVVAAMLDDAQDDLDEVGAGTVVPQTPRQALANAKALSVDAVYVRVGYCLNVVREREFRVAGLWPDAGTAWEEADLKHRETDPTKIPRGAVVYWTNDRYGHVALSAGGGMCWTTDYRRPGYVDLAPIASLAGWCRGQLVGWAEDLNGVDVWPNDRPAPPAFTLEDRIALVRNALARARKNNAPAYRREGLARWLDRLETRLKNRK